MAQKLSQVEKMFQGSTVSDAIEHAHKVKTELATGISQVQVIGKSGFSEMVGMTRVG